MIQKLKLNEKNSIFNILKIKNIICLSNQDD